MRDGSGIGSRAAIVPLFRFFFFRAVRAESTDDQRPDHDGEEGQNEPGKQIAPVLSKQEDNGRTGNGWFHSETDS